MIQLCKLCNSLCKANKFFNTYVERILNRKISKLKSKFMKCCEIIAVYL